jgi:tetratricopeptide (TPR) repeat protein
MVSDESQLISQFAKGNGSVFVGAGLSIGAGLPSWEKLVGPLCQQVNCPASTNYLDIAQYYVNVHDEITLIEHVRRELSKPSIGPTGAHRELIKLPVQRIFTTNLDHLLEDTFRERDLECINVVTDQDLPLMDRGKKSIIKLHGDLGQPQTWVLTSEQYESYFSEHPGIANLLGMDLHSKTVLFLGYSFNDIDMRMILEKVNKRAAGLRKNLFAVQFNPTRLEVEELRRRNIKVIERRGKTKDEKTKVLRQWLVNFIRRVRESPELQETTRHLFELTIDHVNSNLRPLPSNFVDRIEDRERLMSGLRSRFPLIAIKGGAGVGKTSLAIEAGTICSQSRDACSTRKDIFEYIVWISAEDNPTQKQWLNDVLNEIAKTTDNRAMTQLPFETQQEKEEKKKKVTSLLRSYRILIIIDNFETMDDDHELINWLEWLPYPSKAIITSRSGSERLAALSVNLGGMTREEATEFLQQHKALTKGEDERTLKDLVRVTDANPQAMKLALGLLRGEIVELKEIVKQLGVADSNSDRIFQVLFSLAWGKTSDPAHRILLAMPLFLGVSSTSRDALAAVAGLPGEVFKQGLNQCLALSWLEKAPSLPEGAREPECYVIHSKTRDFAREQLDGQPDWERGAKRRCIDYFHELVRKKVVRPQPDQPYWNALVDRGMDDLDPEWPSIQQVLAWADEDGQEDVLVKLVMLLVHYMDSRFKNSERLKYVEKAVGILHDRGAKEEEALLRIDALGWTYVEELKLKEAEQQISCGYDMAQGRDLRALGLAWSARVKVESEKEKRDFEFADKLIQEARDIAREDCSPWIRFRVNMASGDIELKRENAEAALEYYMQAAEEAKSYGGEGGGYQTKPRIGLAYLGMGEIEEAERIFKKLSSLEKIPIAELYGEYGLALVEREKGHQSETLLMLSDVKAKINRYTRSSSNLLLRLIEEQEVRMAES